MKSFKFEIVKKISASYTEEEIQDIVESIADIWMECIDTNGNIPTLKDLPDYLPQDVENYYNFLEDYSFSVFHTEEDQFYPCELQEKDLKKFAKGTFAAFKKAVKKDFKEKLKDGFFE